MVVVEALIYEENRLLVVIVVPSYSLETRNKFVKVSCLDRVQMLTSSPLSTLLILLPVIVV